jgi:AraC-like DNA-binding protein
LTEDPSIADVAAECGLSSTHFARAFKKTTGSPPHAWIIAKRVERAKQLMSGTTLELPKIAQFCGFVDFLAALGTGLRKPHWLAWAGGIEPYKKCLWHRAFSNRYSAFDSIFDSFSALTRADAAGSAKIYVAPGQSADGVS